MNCQHTRRQSMDTESSDLERALVIEKPQTAPTQKKKTIQASESAENQTEKLQADEQNCCKLVLSILAMPVKFS